MHAVTTWVFADHFQFYIYDADSNHFADPALDWKSGLRLAHGYLATERAIYVSTVARLNSHRLRIFIDESPSAPYERVFTSELTLSSGRLVISAPANGPEDDTVLELPVGRYQMSVCSSSVGVDALDLWPDRNEPLTDEEIAAHDDLEHYDLFIQRTA